MARTPGVNITNIEALVNPTATDDASEALDIGSRWVNTANGTVWFCVDTTPGAAVWKNVSASASGSHPVTVDTVDPTASSDVNSGFSIGDHWINITTKQIFQATDVSVGAAVWERIDGPRRNITTTDPAVGNDNTEGYEVGSTWVNTASSPPKVYRAVDVSTGAAIWERITNLRGNATGSDPTINDDTGDGYEVGSLWVNTTTGRTFVATDVSSGAAIWVRTSNRKTNITTIDPTTGDDNTQGYELHSTWINTASFPPRSWTALDVTTANAVWIRKTNVKDNVANAFPSVNNDETEDYEIGSLWFDTIDNEVYVATSVATGAASWKLSTVSGGGSLNNPGEFMFGTLLDYPSPGNVSSGTVFYLRLKFPAGVVFSDMRTFIDSGGTGSRSLRMGIYSQTVPSDVNGVPNTRVAQTESTVTTGQSGLFMTVPLIGGNYTISNAGFYWIAVVSDSTSLKFAVSSAARANFLPVRQESGTGTTLPATAGVLTNPVSSVLYLAAVEA